MVIEWNQQTINLKIKRKEKIINISRDKGISLDTWTKDQKQKNIRPQHAVFIFFCKNLTETQNYPTMALQRGSDVWKKKFIKESKIELTQSKD